MSTSSNRLDISISMSDVLNLIPEYGGGKNEIEFMYFREACRNAAAVLGPQNERLLLIFLKSKLKDEAHMRFGLRLPTYDKLSQFLCDAKSIYAPKCDDPSFWNSKMFAMRQKGECGPNYGAKFQEVLSCATIATKHNEMVKAFLAIQQSKDRPKKLEEPKKIEKKDSVNNDGTKRRRNFEEVMELINAAGAGSTYDNQSPTIESPVSPQPRTRAEKTLSIKGPEYPQIEYPKMPANRPYKKYDQDLKYEYKKDNDDDDSKYELKPKTIVGKTS